jgi:hypothetical protein
MITQYLIAQSGIHQEFTSGSLGQNDESPSCRKCGDSSCHVCEEDTTGLFDFVQNPRSS